MNREALNYASFGYLVTVSQYGGLTTAEPFGRRRIATEPGSNIINHTKIIHYDNY